FPGEPRLLRGAGRRTGRCVLVWRHWKEEVHHVWKEGRGEGREQAPTGGIATWQGSLPGWAFIGSSALLRCQGDQVPDFWSSGPFQVMANSKSDGSELPGFIARITKQDECESWPEGSALCLLGIEFDGGRSLTRAGRLPGAGLLHPSVWASKVCWERVVQRR